MNHRIENMSLLCAILVAAVHIEWDGPAGSAGWFVAETVKDGISRMAVPFFFTVSGYFLSAHFSEDGWWKRETLKRVRSLVVPFFIWILLALIVCAPLGSSAWLMQRPLCAFGFDLSDMPAQRQLWYLRCLMILVVATPVIRHVMDEVKDRCLWLGLAFAAVLLVKFIFRGEITVLRFFEYGFCLRGLFYFSLGMIIREKGPYPTRRVWAVLSLAVAMGLLAAKPFLALAGMGSIGGVMREFAIPFALYGVWHFMPSTALPDCLRGCSFPIYLMHLMVFAYLEFMLSSLPIPMGGVAHGLVVLTCGVAVSVVICNLLRRYFPRVAGFLFCGRA